MWLYPSYFWFSLALLTHFGLRPHYPGEADPENPGFAVVTVGPQHNNPARILPSFPKFLPFTFRLAL